MDNYTELLEEKAECLDRDDDDYEKNIMEIFDSFRGFCESMTEFIQKRGYTGGNYDDQKVKFVQDRFKSSNIPVPRGIKRWFMGEQKPKRNTAFLICFAFGLTVDETNEFFSRVQLERSFDCHTIQEAVYYFGMKNSLSFPEVKEILDGIEKPKKAKALPDQQILYTGSIKDYIDSIDDKEKLIEYIKANIDDFAYNNATAVKYVRELWENISKPDGLAVKEGQSIIFRVART